MTLEQRNKLQEQLDGFIWDFILAARTPTGVDAQLMFRLMLLRENVENWLDEQLHVS